MSAPLQMGSEMFPPNKDYYLRQLYVDRGDIMLWLTNWFRELSHVTAFK